MLAAAARGLTPLAGVAGSRRQGLARASNVPPSSSASALVATASSSAFAGRRNVLLRKSNVRPSYLGGRGGVMPVEAKHSAIPEPKVRIKPLINFAEVLFRIFGHVLVSSGCRCSPASAAGPAVIPFTSSSSRLRHLC